MFEMRTAVRGAAGRIGGDAVNWAWERVVRLGTIRAGQRAARRFAAFGEGSEISFPPTVLHGTSRIEIGAGTTIGPQATLSAGMLVPLDGGRDPLLTIGNHCQLGKSLSIVAHERVVIGDDTCAGHFVFITDQNHGYENVDLPIRTQLWKNAPVTIGPDCWLGNGAIVLPGTTIGRHVAVAAGAVVFGTVPDFSVVAGVPARVVRRYFPEQGWVRVDPDGQPLNDE